MKDREQDQQEIKARLAPSDGSHWYNQKAEPCHEIEMKSKPGQYRNVTKGDATKLGLVPSVTNIMSRCENKVGLDDWKRNQIFDAIRQPGVLERMLAAQGDDMQFNSICKEMDEAARAKSKEAADLGSKFHHFAELMTETIQPNTATLMEKTGLTERQVYACARMFDSSIVCELRHHMLENDGVVLRNERSIVWNEFVDGAEYGVGGRIDLLATVPAKVAAKMGSLHQIISNCPETRAIIDDRISRGLNINILIDWKTRKPTRLKKTPEIPSFPIYPSDPGQLAAYAAGSKRALLIPIHLCISLIIPSDFIACDDPAVPFTKPLHRVFSPRVTELGLKYFHSCIMHWKYEEQMNGSGFAPVVIED